MYFTVHLNLIPGNNETPGKAKPIILVNKSRASDWLRKTALFMQDECKVVTGVHANYNSVPAVKISFVLTFCDAFFMYITNK